MISSHDHVVALFEGDEGEAMARICHRLASGDRGAMLSALVAVVIRPSPLDEDGTFASLALEALAAARLPHLERLVLALIELAAESPLIDLRFTSVAAASDLLFRETRATAMASIAPLANDADEDVARAAGALLARHAT